MKYQTALRITVFCSGLFFAALTVAQETATAQNDPLSEQANTALTPAAEATAIATEMESTSVEGTTTESTLASSAIAPLTEETIVPSLETKDPVLPHDLSPWGMFMQADWVVKAVMMGLLLASIATWTVLVSKTRELRGLVRRQRQALSIVTDASTLKVAHKQLADDQNNSDLAQAAAHELQLSSNTLADADGVKERVASSLERLEAACGRKVSRGTSILASIGSTAPFVGLFGTVWGIMNSFIGISKAQTTNLAVVAPGIAEALLATALGLVAAIPAVVIYNHFARQIASYKALVGDTAAAILRLVSRDLSQFAIHGKQAMEPQPKQGD